MSLTASKERTEHEVIPLLFIKDSLESSPCSETSNGMQEALGTAQSVGLVNSHTATEVAISELSANNIISEPVANSSMSKSASELLSNNHMALPTIATSNESKSQAGSYAGTESCPKIYSTNEGIIQNDKDSIVTAMNPSEELTTIPPTALTSEQKRLRALQSRHTANHETLTSLTSKRNALLHSFTQHLSPHLLSTIPSAQARPEPPYYPSILAHTISAPPSFLKEDEEKIIVEAKKVIKGHIKRLHRYNEIRDVGQGLIGMIAEQRGVRIVDCLEEFGVEPKD